MGISDRQHWNRLGGDTWDNQHKNITIITWSAAVLARAPARHKVHKAPEAVQHLQPVLPQRRPPQQVAAVLEAHKDAVRDDLAHRHGGLSSVKGLKCLGICKECWLVVCVRACAVGWLRGWLVG